MRAFTDRDGNDWIAAVRSTSGADYKGRHHLVMRDADGGEVELADIRWNSERTAQRTLDTMSVAELRRRLRSALGRAAAPVAD